MKKAMAVLALALLLTGCGYLRAGSYTSVIPHEEAYAQDQPDQAVPVRNYAELLSVLQSMVNSRAESGVLDVSAFAQGLEEQISRATSYITEVYPLGSYAVRSMNVVVDQSGASRRANVTISYGVTTAQMRSIQSVRGKAAAQEAIEEALVRLPATLVLQIAAYEAPDVAGIVARYAAQNPERVVEIPTVTVRTMPETGSVRIVEITFTYSRSYAELSAMGSQVRAVFDSAKSSVSDLEDPYAIAQGLYHFLMSRFDYTVGTTATPAYSLLCQGVGDSRAFAQIYGALCRQAGLACYVVEGTRAGESWNWNIIEFAPGDACHVDLLADYSSQAFILHRDEEMGDYTWDAEQYPACIQPLTTTTEPTGEPTENS